MKIFFGAGVMLLQAIAMMAYFGSMAWIGIAVQLGFVLFAAVLISKRTVESYHALRVWSFMAAIPVTMLGFAAIFGGGEASFLDYLVAFFTTGSAVVLLLWLCVHCSSEIAKLRARDSYDLPAVHAEHRRREAQSTMPNTSPLLRQIEELKAEKASLELRVHKLELEASLPPDPFADDLPLRS